MTMELPSASVPCTAALSVTPRTGSSTTVDHTDPTPLLLYVVEPTDRLFTMDGLPP